MAYDVLNALEGSKFLERWYTKLCFRCISSTLLAADWSVTEQGGFYGLKRSCQLGIEVYVVAQVAD